MAELIYLKGVSTLELEEGLCVGCGVCLEVCPHGVLRRREQKVVIGDRDACMECGACARNCTAGALRVQTGVGCASAVIGSALSRRGGTACC